MLSYDVCECGAPLQRMERDTPKATGTEVVLKVLAAGVCHSDLHIWDGYYDIGGGQKLKLLDRGIKLPLTMGHENVGEVIDVGPDAKGVRVGDVRLVHPWQGCGECGEGRGSSMADRQVQVSFGIQLHARGEDAEYSVSCGVCPPANSSR